MKTEALFDYLDYKPDETLKLVVTSIEDLSSDGEGFLAGIKGDWGTGKTSILRALEGYYRYFVTTQPCKGEMFIARGEENSNQLREERNVWKNVFDWIENK